MTKGDLMKFCSDEVDRYTLNKPWSEGAHSYASNGHIIIRIPRLADVPERKDAPKKCDTMFNGSKPPEWHALAGMELPKEKVEKCPLCKGRKKYYKGVCYECDGNGIFVRPAPFNVGDVTFQVKYLHWLKALPNCRIGPTDKQKQAPFMFDGGDGLLMPFRPFE